MITGYFMCKKNISIKKWLTLFFEIVFYNIVISIIFYRAGYKIDIRYLLPINDLSNGYVPAYLVFYLFIPFLNKIVNNIDKKQFLILLGLSFLFFSVWPSIGYSVTINYVFWFCIVYFWGSYVRLFPEKWMNNRKITGILFLTVCICMYCIRIWIYYQTVKNAMPVSLTYGVFKWNCDSNKIFALLFGVSSFLFFKNLKIKKNKFINTVAASVFGVLLIHANSLDMRVWLWHDFLRGADSFYIDSPYLMILYAFFCVFAVFIVCVVIDYLRIRLIEEPLVKHVFKNRLRRIDRKS